MRVYTLHDDGQSDAGTGDVPPLRGLALVESIKYPASFCAGYSGALIRDIENSLILVAADDDVNSAVFWRILDGIGYQIIQCHANFVPVCRDGNILHGQLYRQILGDQGKLRLPDYRFDERL